MNNAGATWGAKAEEHPLAAWDKVMDLNIRGYFLLSQAVARAGMLQRGGRIINISSIAGLGGNPGAMRTLAYNTSKRRGAELHPRIGGRVGAAGHYGECRLPRVFPHQNGFRLD